MNQIEWKWRFAAGKQLGQGCILAFYASPFSSVAGGRNCRALYLGTARHAKSQAALMREARAKTRAGGAASLFGGRQKSWTRAAWTRRLCAMAPNERTQTATESSCQPTKVRKWASRGQICQNIQSQRSTNTKCATRNDLIFSLIFDISRTKISIYVRQQTVDYRSLSCYYRSLFYLWYQDDGTNTEILFSSSPFRCHSIIGGASS